MNMTEDEDLRVIGSLLREVKSLAAPQATGVAQINVSAGGAAVWLAVCACVVSVVVTAVASIFFGMTIQADRAETARQMQELRQKDDTFQAYINMIYNKQEKKQ